MNQSTTSGSAHLSLNDLVDAMTRLETTMPWRAMLGKARIQVTSYLTDRDDGLVMNVGWLSSTWSALNDGVEWVVILSQATLDAILDVSRVVMVSWPGGAFGVGAAAQPTITEAELAAMLAWHAKIEWEAKRDGRRRCSCQGVVNLACPEHGNIS
jgi:hypothetical protein